MDLTKYDIAEVLSRFGIEDVNPGATTGSLWLDTSGDITESISPVDGKVIAKVKNASKDDYETVVQKAEQAFTYWKSLPAPKRGEIVRQIGLALR